MRIDGSWGVSAVVEALVRVDPEEGEGLWRGRRRGPRRNGPWTPAVILDREAHHLVLSLAEVGVRVMCLQVVEGHAAWVDALRCRDRFDDILCRVHRRHELSCRCHARVGAGIAPQEVPDAASALAPRGASVGISCFLDRHQVFTFTCGPPWTVCSKLYKYTKKSIYM